MKEEIWKDVEGFSRYKVSNTGRVWDTKTNKEVSQVETGIPVYKYVNMNRDDGKRKLVRVHRLVALAFIPLEEGYDIVDHIDRDKFNNHVSNLRWVDHSGNQRNKDDNTYVDGKLLMEILEDEYGNTDNYQFFKGRITTKGESFHEAKRQFERYCEHGRLSKEVEWKGEIVFLADLCKRYNKDYSSVVSRLVSGSDIWNALHNVPETCYYSVEVHSETGVTLWFPTREYAADSYGIGRRRFVELLYSESTHEQLQSYNSLNHLRQTVLNVTGTISELCKHFKISENTVSDRRRKHGMSLEEALTTPLKRVKMVTINGETNTPKYWFIYFGLDLDKVNLFRGRKSKPNFEEILEHFGVTTSVLEISYGC